MPVSLPLLTQHFRNTRMWASIQAGNTCIILLSLPDWAEAKEGHQHLVTLCVEYMNARYRR